MVACIEDQVDIGTDQQPFHSRSAPRGQSILWFHIWFSSSPSSVLELLRLSLSQPTRYAL